MLATTDNPARKHLIPRSEQHCANCSAFMPDPGQVNQGVCRARPPVPLMVGVQQLPAGLTRGGAQMPVIQGIFPPMRATSWCREWEQQMEGEA